MSDRLAEIERAIAKDPQKWAPTWVGYLLKRLKVVEEYLDAKELALAFYQTDKEPPCELLIRLNRAQEAWKEMK